MVIPRGKTDLSMATMKIEKPRKFSADEVMARLDEVSYVPCKNPNKQKTRKRCRNGEPV
jgi:hypothetical protein